MRQLAELLNEMRESGVVQNYALFGAAAQMRYTEPVATLDADVLVSLSPSHDQNLEVLRGIYEFCAARGFPAEGEAIRVGAWPTQFVPAFSPLTHEAMERAETADYEGIPLRVVRADYLAVINMLERQARWQKGRAALSWPEKIRMAEAIRESVRLLRKGGGPADREAERRRRP